jgi:hypothetical protein
MKTLETKVFKINGKFDKYASENTQRTENYADLAVRMGRDYSAMSKRQKANFRKRHSDKINPINTVIEIFEVKAHNVPNIFSEYQLRNAAINNLIHNSDSLFLECKNGETGYRVNDFSINLIKK